MQLSIDQDSSSHALTEAFRHTVQARGVERVLRAVRRHLSMDVAFVSRFSSTDRLLEHVDSVANAPLKPNQRIPLEQGYCLKVVRGELPECIPDTARVAATQGIPETHAIPIGSHLSVPVKLEDGQVYGTLCCFSFRPNPTLGERDMQLMRAFAEVLALRLDEDTAAQRERAAQADYLRSVMSEGAPAIVYQPICDVVDGAVRGFECLSRFRMEPLRAPDDWFRSAHEAGIGPDVELHAIRQALAPLDRFPVGLSLSVNSSPDLILSDRLQSLFEDRADLSRVVIEVTEHAAVGDYVALSDAVAPLRARGAKLAVDDAGAGYSSMRHILNLAPEIIKLDMSITRNVDSDVKRRALARGLTHFGHEIGALVIAEGVETAAELDALKQLGVNRVQGYFLARPVELDAALAFASDASKGERPMRGRDKAKRARPVRS